MERERLAELFRQYGDDMFRLAFSYVGSRPDAEDIVQSVLLKLAEGRHGPAQGKEKAWLLTCTANACKNHLRSFWRRNVGALDESVPFEDREDRALYGAVMALPPKYRAVIHLYYYEGYDQGEISQILQISRTAVQTRMSRARNMVKKELSDDEISLPTDDGAGTHGG